MSTRAKSKKPSFVILLPLLWALRASAADPATPIEVNSTATPMRPSTQATIDKHELLGHIQHLSSPEFNGREAGTPDQLKAAAYVADEFKRYGLEPFGDTQNGKAGYIQFFPMTTVSGAGKETALALTLDGKDKHFSAQKEFAPFPTALVKTKGSGGIAFAGYGIIAPEIPYDDFDKIDLAGKWALILRYEPQEKDEKSKFKGKEHTRHAALSAKILNCAVRRAAGVLIVTGPAGREKEQEKLTDSRGALIGEFSIPVFQITRAAADAILSASGKDIASLQTAIDKSLSSQSFAISGAQLTGISELQYDERPTANVIARLEGQDETLKNECVVIGAHCDHIGMGSEGSLLGKGGNEGKGKLHPGADDNASGTAGLLEIAQYFGALKFEERPRRTILFMAFSGEEKGLLGSEHYLKRPKVPVQNTVAMLNMDMIGRSSSGGVQIVGVGTGKGFKALIQTHATDERMKIHVGSGGSGPSDHASFHEKKIPVLFFFTGIHADYHRPADTWEKINAPVSEAIAALAAKVLFSLADNLSRPEFVQGSSGGYLGVSPDSKRADEKGFAIGEVLPDSPAFAAGLKAGDVIREVNGQPLSSAMDLSMSLIDLSPGDTVEISVKRGDEKIDRKITLGQRKAGKEK